MPLRIYRHTDASPDPLRDAPIAVVGYGNQGRAHALNLRDSGFDIHIGQRPGPSFERALADGFQPVGAADACRRAGLVIMTLPDESAAKVYADELADVIRPGTAIGFVHGFNIRYRFIKPPTDVDVIMVAPKGPGTLLRSLYTSGKGLPALVAVAQDATGRAFDRALAWAAGIGATRAGVVRTTFATETETDLFGEQVVLCGGVAALTKTAFDVLVSAGYEPEFAYLECVHELKQVVDLLYEHGLSGMRERISNTAEYGDLTRGPRIIDAAVRRKMETILQEIQDGTFAREWMEEHQNGGATFRALHEADANTPYEKAGAAVRALMPWLGNDEDG